MERDFSCKDCGREDYTSFMLTKEVWYSIATQNTILCLDCTVNRLGRELTPDDFTNAPINNYDVL